MNESVCCFQLVNIEVMKEAINWSYVILTGDIAQDTTKCISGVSNKKTQLQIR